MIDNSQQWIEQADHLLETSGGVGAGSRAAHFATSMLTALYGPNSTQLKEFRDGCARIADSSPNSLNMDHNIFLHARGTVEMAKMELQAGLIVRLRVAVAGEILVELIELAKDVLNARTDQAKNVAAVLTASAYEGLIRRMGEEFAGILDRPKLEQVINILKDANVLKGGQVSTAQSYLKFRNDSLHADWNNLDRSQVESCLAFSESLLIKHFS